MINVFQRKPEKHLENHFGGLITSYVLAHRDNPEKHLTEMAEYVASKIEGTNAEIIQQEIRKVIERMNKPDNESSLKAKLFTKDGKVRKYRYGHDFCEKCGMFKNYEKECPYCGHHEMTI